METIDIFSRMIWIELNIRGRFLLKRGANLLGISLSKLRYLCDTGRINCVKTPRGRRTFLMQAINAYLEQSQAPIEAIKNTVTAEPVKKVPEQVVDANRGFLLTAYKSIRNATRGLHIIEGVLFLEIFALVTAVSAIFLGFFFFPNESAQFFNFRVVKKGESKTSITHKNCLIYRPILVIFSSFRRVFFKILFIPCIDVFVYV